jgi:TonB family protein
MQKLWAVALFAAVATNLSGGQSPAPVPSSTAQPERVKVFPVAPGVTAPVLLPLDLPPFPSTKCKKKMDGLVELSVIVDAAGRPRNLMFIHPLGTDLDKFALQIANQDRFTPGTSDGAPVAVVQSIEVKMQSCIDENKDSTGKKIYSLRLRSAPSQKLASLPQPPREAVLTSDKYRPDYSGNASGSYRVGGSVTAPVVLFEPEAEFTDAARKAKYQGACLISLVVDRNGMPQNLQVKKALDYGLSEKALEAVSHYRFKPAMKDGEHVPVTLYIEVSFRLYDR